MLDLNAKVFGELTSKEVIGETPLIEDLEKKLAAELKILVEQLDGKSQEELHKLRDHQADMERQVNGRPGAMALSQSKIRLYTDYSKQYLDILDCKMG